MKILHNAIGVIALVAVLSPSLLAQWPPFPVPGVPRTPTGEPNLSAPAPRTADGKPDLSGIWQNPRPPAGEGPGFLSGNVGGAAGARPWGLQRPGLPHPQPRLQTDLPPQRFGTLGRG